MKQKHEHLEIYVIHTRAFRETSLLVELFSKKLGRCSAIARGTYSGKSPTRFLLQPFQPLSVHLQGSTELLNLSKVERLAILPNLAGQSLVCGLYLNELLYHTLHRYDPHPELFHAYAEALGKLTAHQSQIALREFELRLLASLGYGIHFENVHITSEFYRYDPQQGFLPSMHGNGFDIFPTSILLALAKNDWHFPQTLGAARLLTRIALAPLLGNKEIRSRELL